MGEPRETAYRKGYSDASNMPFKHRELVYAKRKWLKPASQNYLLYSDYNTSFWTVDTASDAGLISMGPNADKNRCSIAIDGTVTEFGVQTWIGDGTIRSNTATDISGWTSLVFSMEFGRYQRSSAIDYTCVIGLRNSAGTQTQTLRTLSVKGGNRIWATVNIADITLTDLTDVCFTVSVTASESGHKWYFCRAQLEKDVTSPGEFISTAGASQVLSTASVRRGIAKIHRSEWEFIQEEWEDIATPREGQDQSSYTVPVEDVS